MRVFGQHDEKTLTQLEQVAQSAVGVALMADGHLGYVMPIGGVAAYRDAVSVAGVGFDRGETDFRALPTFAAGVVRTPLSWMALRSGQTCDRGADTRHGPWLACLTPVASVARTGVCPVPGVNALAGGWKPCSRKSPASKPGSPGS